MADAAAEVRGHELYTVRAGRELLSSRRLQRLAGLEAKLEVQAGVLSRRATAADQKPQRNGAVGGCIEIA